jgi:MYXO-CTERM domain-containing protein
VGFRPDHFSFGKCIGIDVVLQAPLTQNQLNMKKVLAIFALTMAVGVSTPVMAQTGTDNTTTTTTATHGDDDHDGDSGKWGLLGLAGLLGLLRRNKREQVVHTTATHNR